ncbi:MAG: hypothetical protein KGY65_03095 [Candidatus Thermoplasmatota archaeon]|nr:hypothetical protein [Candidatus Thermoplasmatota archaeon]MBS3801716.1 hypothetical protein [Candidatus Thermoplasmatota archaeon]
MVLDNIIEGINAGFYDAFESIVAALPGIIAAIIILLIGYIIGKIVGGGVRRLLEKAKTDKKIAKNTIIKRMLDSVDMTFSKLMGVLVSLFFYVVFILAAVDVLQIQILSTFVNAVLLYLPHLIAGILVLIVGLIAVEWIVSFIQNTMNQYKVSLANIITLFFRAVLTLVVIVITLDQWKIDTSIIYTFIQPLAWGVAAAIAVAFGWGFKDIVGDWAKKQAKELTKEK